MKTFAILLNPRTIKEAKKFWPMSGIVPDGLFTLFCLRHKNPRVLKLCDLSSISGKQASGYVVVYPVSLYKESGQNDDFIISQADNVLLAVQNLGVNMLGLCGFDKKTADSLQAIAAKLKIPVTNGNALTAWTIFESVYRAAKRRSLDLKNAALVIIGADEPLGVLCAKKFSAYVRKMIISGKDRNKLISLQETLSDISGLRLDISDNIYEDVKVADITVNSDGNFNQHEFKSGSIICGTRDKFSNKNLSSGVTSIQCGLIKLPFNLGLSRQMNLAANIADSCFAETMLLTLEEKFVNYSTNNDINPDKMEEIADMAAKNGFQVSE